MDEEQDANDDDEQGDHLDDTPINNQLICGNWLFDVDRKPQPSASELAFGRVKAFLYESIHRSITRHNLKESFELLKLLPKETTLDPYVLFRYIFILIESNSHESINANVIIYLESLLSRLDLIKPDVFVEFLAYFIRHNRIGDARELFAQRHKYIARKTHRQVPFIDVNLRCYEFLLNYLDWNDRISNDNTVQPFDVSIQGWIVNVIDCLKSVESNYEYFVMCVTKVLLYYGYIRKAYLFVSEFQRNNPNNISAQLLLYTLIERLEPLSKRKKLKINTNGEVAMDCEITDEQRSQNRLAELAKINNFSLKKKRETINFNKYPIEEDKKAIYRNLRLLDPTREEVLKLSCMHDNLIDILKDLLDGMEVLSEVRNISRWTNIKQILQDIISYNEEAILIDASFLWQTRYKRWWRSVDFVAIAEKQAGKVGQKITKKEAELIREVTSMLSNTLNRPIR